MTSYRFQSLIAFALFLGIVTISQVHGQALSELRGLDDMLVRDALKNINQQISEKKGNIERVSCCYKVSGKKPLSAAIKTFYVDYRKKPDYKEYSFKKTAKNNPDQLIEVIYKSNNKKELAIVSKDPTRNNRRGGCKYIEIS